MKHYEEYEVHYTCPECDCALGINKGECVCPECGKSWSELLFADEEYYDETISAEYNSIIAFEYAEIKELLQQKQIYGLLFQIKDMYEVITRIPVLIVAAYLNNRPGMTLNDTEKDFMWKLLSKPLSFGDWRSALDQATKIVKDLDIHGDIKEMCRITRAFANDNRHGDIVNWRNEQIGHGALKLSSDTRLYSDVIEKIGDITAFLKKNKYYYTEIEIRTRGSETALEGQNIDFAKISKNIYLHMQDGTEYETDPFFYVNEDGIFFYDRYIAKKHNTDIIEYLRSKKQTLFIKSLRDIYEILTECETSGVNETGYFVEERELVERILIAKDFYEPEFLTEWLTRNIDNGEKVMLLQMEEGMGKSSFVRALDPFSGGEIVLDDVAVRAFYINSTYNSRVDDFLISVSDTLRKVDKDRTAAVIKEPDRNSSDPKKAFADTLNYCKKNLYPDRTLLFVFDGLDELSIGRGQNITDFIPEKEMLDDGVVVLLTARTFLDSDGVVPFIRNYLSHVNAEKLYLTVNDERYTDFAYGFFKHNVINKLKSQSKKNGIVFNPSEEYLKDYFAGIARKSCLYLSMMYEVLSMELRRNKQGKTPGKEIELYLNKNIFSSYFESLEGITGKRYHEKFIKVLSPLSLASAPLGLNDLALLAFNTAPDFAFLGFINSISIFLSKKRTRNGTVFELAHLEQKKAVLSIFKEKHEAFLEKTAAEILELLKKPELIGPEDYCRFTILESLFAYYGEKQKKADAENLFKGLLGFPFTQNWAKVRPEAAFENMLITSMYSYYVSSDHVNDEKTDIRMAFILTVMGLNNITMNFYGACDPYFSKAIEIYDSFYGKLTDFEKKDFENTLTIYATYKLIVKEFPEGKMLYSRGMDIVYELYEKKSNAAPLEFYLNERICMSNVHRDCGEYEEAYKLIQDTEPKLDLCTNIKAMLKMKAFINHGKGKLFMRQGRYSEAIEAFTVSVEWYRECEANEVKFYIPDCVVSFMGLTESLAVLGRKEETVRTIKMMNEYVEQRENAGLLDNHECSMSVYKTRAVAYKTLGDTEKYEAEKAEAIRFFKETLTDEEREKTVFLDIIQSI